MVDGEGEKPGDVEIVSFLGKRDPDWFTSMDSVLGLSINDRQRV